MSPKDDAVRSEGAEIQIGGNPDPEAAASAVGSSSSFFSQTNENVNAALLDLLESVFRTDRKAGFPGPGVPGKEAASCGAADASCGEHPDALLNHPWFHPPRVGDFPVADPEDSGFISTNKRQDFYRQAGIYAAREGVPCEEAPFSNYFPDYSGMGPGQLDWYFYWRSCARKRIFIRTTPSYVFLHFYELIHQIGFSSPEDALEQILFVWKEARLENTVFDPYLAIWVRDFILYYDLKLEYYTVVEGILGEDTGRYLYQECLLYFLKGEKKSGFLHALEALSDYPVTAGRYYKDGYGPFLDDAVWRILSLWNRKYAEKGKGGLLAAMCKDLPLRSTVRPFESALFYEYGQRVPAAGDSRTNSSVTYEFSARTIESTLIPGLNGVKRMRRFITGFLRTVESDLRERTGYRWSIRKGRLPKGQLALIEKQCADFYREYQAEQKRKEKKIFRVDNDVLMKLKVDSEEIREHLISRQEQDAGSFPAPGSDPYESALEEELTAADEEAETTFSSLFCQFDPLQYRMIALLCEFASFSAAPEADRLLRLRRIAATSNTFPDVIIETINDLAVERIGDCIIDSGGAIPFIYADYLDEIKEAIAHGGKQHP